MTFNPGGLPVKYFSPSTIEEAVELLSSGPNRRVFAGATDVVPQMRSGRPAPDGLIDLKGIERLISVTDTGSMWVIGAAAPTVRLTSNPAFVASFPGLAEASGLIGSDQVQSRSSLGGNLCNSSPAADSVPALFANRARAVIASGAGTRTIAVQDVPTGPGRTSLAPGEFIIEFEIDRPTTNSGDAYFRLTPRTEMDIAVVGAGARVDLDGAGTISSATLALGAVAPTVVRVPDAEAALLGAALTNGAPSDDVLAAVAAAASAACNPIDDKRGTIKYRRHVAGVLARRSILAAIARASAA
ncbi:MAG: xanthine dehydrogenase family protein subunit M [Actinomycetota bacterium]|nr:xanthine dehydrogenase family protein subunit M [Actinomycetota bacterium]